MAKSSENGGAGFDPTTEEQRLPWQATRVCARGEVLWLGDRRIDGFRTSYSLDFDAPFEESKCIRSPMRNYDLAKSGISLKNHYAGSYNRVGQYALMHLVAVRQLESLRRERLLKMMTRMRERLEAKLGNSNDNAFKLRKLFKMYDSRNTGLVIST